MMDSIFALYIHLLKKCQKKIGEHRNNLKKLRLQESMTSPLFQRKKSREISEAILAEQAALDNVLVTFNFLFECVEDYEEEALS